MASRKYFLLNTQLFLQSADKWSKGRKKEAFMMAGGFFEGSSKACALSKLYDLFVQFRSLHEQVRGFNKDEKPAIKLGDRTLILSSNNQTNLGEVESYSRTTRLDNGNWVTVQARRWKGVTYFDTTRLEIFDDKGNSIALAASVDCETGNPAISKQGKEDGKDAIIQGALRAVTNQEYSVAVDE